MWDPIMVHPKATINERRQNGRSIRLRVGNIATQVMIVSYQPWDEVIATSKLWDEVTATHAMIVSYQRWENGIDIRKVELWDGITAPHVKAASQRRWQGEIFIQCSEPWDRGIPSRGMIVWCWRWEEERIIESRKRWREGYWIPRQCLNANLSRKWSVIEASVTRWNKPTRHTIHSSLTIRQWSQGLLQESGPRLEPHLILFPRHRRH